jgi:hypothetical protein
MTQRLLVAVLAAVVVLVTASGARANHTQPIGVKCTDFAAQADAQAYLREHPYDADGMDGPPGPNNDTTGKKGVACEDLDCPCDTTPVTYVPGHDGPTYTTLTPIVPGGLQTTVTAPVTGQQSTTSPPGTARTSPNGGEPLAAPAARSTGRDTGYRLGRGILIAGATAFVVMTYAAWLRRDRRRQYWPTRSPRWPTEW